MQLTYYVYISYENNSDRFYIGSSQCYGDPNKHNYFGSGFAIRSGEFKPDYKWVYGIYETRLEAGLAEKELIKQADYRNNKLCMNKNCVGSNNTEAKAKNASKAMSGDNNPMHGKAHSAEAKAKMSKSSMGNIPGNRDNRLHRFVHKSGKEIIDLYCNIRNNAKTLMAISKCSAQGLKEGKTQSVKGWQYAGVVEQELAKAVINR